MKKLLFLFALILVSTSALAYYSNTGTYDGRTRIDMFGYGAQSETGATGGQHPVTANYTATYAGYIGAFDLPADNATFIITKTATPNPVDPRGQINYTITITNLGNATAYNVTLNETYPVGVTYANASPQPNVSNNFWIIGNMTTNQTFQVNITVNVTASSGSLVNTINVSYLNTFNRSFSIIVTQTTTIRRPGRVSGGGGSASRVTGLLQQDEILEKKKEQIEKIQEVKLPEPEPEQPATVREKVVVKQEPKITEAAAKTEVKKRINYKQIYIFGTALALLTILIVLVLKFGTRKKEATTSELQAKITTLKKLMKEFDKKS